MPSQDRERWREERLQRESEPAIVSPEQLNEAISRLGVTTPVKRWTSITRTRDVCGATESTDASFGKDEETIGGDATSAGTYLLAQKAGSPSNPRFEHDGGGILAESESVMLGATS